MSKRTDAAIFRRAAEYMDEPSHRLGACRAIDLAVNGDYVYSTPQHDLFDAVFPQDDGDYEEHWQWPDDDASIGDDCHYGPRAPRVLGLLFIAAMLEAGDL